MKFSIREAELFADKNNFIPGVSYIFIEPSNGGYYAFTYAYDPLTKNPVSYAKLSVAKGHDINGIMGEIKEFQDNYGLSAGVMTKNEQDQWEYVKSTASVNYRIKIAQTVKEHTENLGSTNVNVDPSSLEVDEAIRILQSKAPDVLTDITDIKTNLSKNVYGEYVSTEPHIIHLNLEKIKSDVRSKLQGKQPDELNKEIVNQIALVISHESGHEHAYTNTKDSSEAPAEQKEKEVSEKIRQ